MRSFRVRLALIALAGLAIRVAVTLGPARDVKGFGDWHYFSRGANLNADGHWFIDPFVWNDVGREVASASHAPLWELVLTAVSWAGGTTYLAHRLVGCALGAVAIVLIGLLARRVGGERAGVAAAVLATLYPILVAADHSLLSESLYGVLVAGILLLAFRLLDGAGAWTAAALGATIALAALTRSEALLLMAFLALPLAWLAGPRDRRVRRCVAAIAAAVLVLAPWTVRNWVDFGRPVLISTQDGALLAGANCDRTYRGVDIGNWRLDCLSERTTENEAKQSHQWRKEGGRYALDNAGRWPAVVGARVLRTWGFFQPRRMVMFAEGRWRPLERAGIVVYYLLLPLALAGGWLIRRRRSELAILLAPVVLVFVQSVVGYGTPRFRMAAEIVIVVLAAQAIVALSGRLSAARAGSRPAAAASSA